LNKSILKPALFLTTSKRRPQYRRSIAKSGGQSPSAEEYTGPDASAVLSVVAPLHPPVRQSGIHCRTIFAIRLSDRTSFNEN